YTAVPTVSRAQAGISLGVTPVIAADGVTTLSIVPIVTDLVAYKTFVFEGNSFDVPIIDVRGTASIVRAADGETVIIAGMIQDKNQDNVSGIPFLKDIPLVGFLFSQQTRTKQKVELVISLTPTIIER
ncbi:MAG: pilus (MSHA type) biogenesis protein MshL, partial [Pseudomonadota bacterium]